MSIQEYPRVSMSIHKAQVSMSIHEYLQVSKSIQEYPRVSMSIEEVRVKPGMRHRSER